MFCPPVFVFLSFLCWLKHYLSFFDILSLLVSASVSQQYIDYANKVINKTKCTRVYTTVNQYYLTFYWPKTVSNHSIKAESRTLIGWSFVYIKQFAGKIQNDRMFPQKQQRNFRVSPIPDTRYSGRLRKFKMAGKRAVYLGQQLIWRRKSKLFSHLSHIIT